MSFFDNLLNNAVTSGAGLMSDYVMRQRQLEDEQRREEMMVERQRQLDQNRMTMQEEALNRQRKMTADEMTQVDEQAPAVTRARQLAEAQQQAPSLDAEGMNVVMQNLSPEDLKKYYGVDTSPTAALRDQLGVARKGGMYNAESKLEEMYKEAVQTLSLARQDRVAESQIEANKALAKQRGAKADAIPDETAAKQTQAEAALARAQRQASGGSNAGGSSAGKSFKVQELDDGRLVRITRDGVEDLGLTGNSAQKMIDGKVTVLLKDDVKVGGKRFSQLTPEEQYDHAAQLVLQGPRKPGAPRVPVGGAPTPTPSSRINQFKVLR